MRIGGMQIEEEVPVPVTLEPRNHPRTVDLFGRHAQCLLVVELAEPLVQPGVRTGIAILEEGRGDKPLAAHDLRERQVAIAQHVGEVPDASSGRVERRHQRRHGRSGLGCLRDRPVELNAALLHQFDLVWRGVELVAVRREIVGPQRILEHDNDVEWLLRRRMEERIRPKRHVLRVTRDH